MRVLRGVARRYPSARRWPGPVTDGFICGFCSSQENVETPGPLAWGGGSPGLRFWQVCGFSGFTVGNAADFDPSPEGFGPQREKREVYATGFRLWYCAETCALLTNAKI
jgi:hypothetical protein